MNMNSVEIRSNLQNISTFLFWWIISRYNAYNTVILHFMTNFVHSKLVGYKWMIWVRFITTKALIQAHLSPSLIFFSLIPIIFHVISYPIILHYNDKIIGAQLKCKKWMIGKRILSVRYYVIYNYEKCG